MHTEQSYQRVNSLHHFKDVNITSLPPSDRVLENVQAYHTAKLRRSSKSNKAAKHCCYGKYLNCPLSTTTQAFSRYSYST